MIDMTTPDADYSPETCAICGYTPNNRADEISHNTDPTACEPLHVSSSTEGWFVMSDTAIIAGPFRSKAIAETFVGIRNRTAALAVLHTHDTEIKELLKLTKAALAQLRKDEQRIIVIAGQISKHEIINDIISYRYPCALMDRATHVAYHKPGENWSACPFCQVSK